MEKIFTNRLQLDHVYVRKYDTPVLLDINWCIQPGQHWAIIGGNGSGKTTLLEVIAGKWAPRSGKITRNATFEFVASDYSFNRIIRSAALYYQQRFQSQDAEIAPTVKEVITDQLKPVGTVDDRSVVLPPNTVSESKLQHISQLLSLTDLLDKPFVTLSNGETRRMLLARSLVKSPEMIFLDYPFTGLDTHSRRVLKEALSHIAIKDCNIIMATAANEIPDFITHIIELEHGKVVKIGHKQDFDLHDKQNNNRFHFEQSLQHLEELGPPQQLDFEYAFRLRNTRVVYDENAVLEGVNWEVKQGERWALSGPNGSGKSTLLSLITADHPQRFANDFDIFDRPKRGKGFSMWDIKQRIGHVSPELHLYFPAEINVFKTIGSGFFDATGVYFRKLTSEQEARILLVAKLLQVDTLIDKPFKFLSKGEQRLVLLARALVKNPPLLILDEPCQGLDIASVEYFKSVIDAICEKAPYTLIYVSHYPHEIPKCVTKHLHLEAGKVKHIVS